MWAPWRIEYILGPKEDGCFICRARDGADDRDSLLLQRGATCMVMMNRYPYSGGHLMVSPLRHVDTLQALTAEERTEAMDLCARSIDILTEVMKPQGFNVGLNLGEAAGAGLRDHLHWHIVPRWNGDTNFMAVAGSTRVIPQALEELHAILRPRFDRP